MWPGFDSRTRRHMWVEFVVGSHPCSERFFCGYSGFPLSSKTNISKFQFDLDYCQALYHEPLARKIAQALLVLLTLNLNLFEFNRLFVNFFKTSFGPASVHSFVHHNYTRIPSFLPSFLPSLFDWIIYHLLSS